MAAAAGTGTAQGRRWAAEGQTAGWVAVVDGPAVRTAGPQTPVTVLAWIEVRRQLVLCVRDAEVASMARGAERRSIDCEERAVEVRCSTRQSAHGDSRVQGGARAVRGRLAADGAGVRGIARRAVLAECPTVTSAETAARNEAAADVARAGRTELMADAVDGQTAAIAKAVGCE